MVHLITDDATGEAANSLVATVIGFARGSASLDDCNVAMQSYTVAGRECLATLPGPQ